ncbi:uncharacterized protein LOC141905686 [Tubulanus polymorphus]|uniref:uncharacterized protein LOC141905686 n=1 Tax=Tubulanus polymorphus TaxID=672921 RepID=UPI003DA4BEDB
MGLIISFFSSIIGKFRSSKDEQLKRKFEVKNGITLFDTTTSPACRQVRIVMIQKGMRWRNISVDLLKCEQNSIHYKKLCPNQKIPALTIKNIPCLEDSVIYESSVINEYLDTEIPGENLFPRDLFERTQARSWIDWQLGIGLDFQHFSYQNTFVLFVRAQHSKKAYYLSANDGPVKRKFIKAYDGRLSSPEEMVAHAENLYFNLMIVEKALNNRKYLVGETFSIADISVYSWVVMYEWIGLPISVDNFPNVYHWLKHIADIECVAASLPLGWQIFIKFLPWVTALVERIGNWRTGHKFARVNGQNVADRVVSQWPERSIPAEPPVKRLSKEDIILFHYSMSAECWQIKLLLSYKNLEYKCIMCDNLELFGRPAGSDGIIRLQHGDRLITGIRAIVEYIDAISTHNGALIPEDSSLKTECRCWQTWDLALHQHDMHPVYEMDLYSAYLHDRYNKENIDDLLSLRSDVNYQSKFPVIMKCFMNRVDYENDPDWKHYVDDYSNLLTSQKFKEQLKIRSQKRFHESFAYLNTSLKNKRYILGEELSMADLLLYVSLLFMPYVGMKISAQKYAKIARWMNDIRRISDVFNAIACDIQTALDRFMYTEMTSALTIDSQEILLMNMVNSIVVRRSNLDSASESEEDEDQIQTGHED